MSQLPLHLADFDYNDPAKIKEYKLVMNKAKDKDAAWADIEARVVALTEITDAAEREAAVADLEGLRDDARAKQEKYQAALVSFLPNIPTEANLSSQIPNPPIPEQP